MEDIEQYYIYFKENVCSWELTTTLTNRKVKDVLYILKQLTSNPSPTSVQLESVRRWTDLWDHRFPCKQQTDSLHSIQMNCGLNCFFLSLDYYALELGVVRKQNSVDCNLLMSSGDSLLILALNCICGRHSELCSQRVISGSVPGQRFPQQTACF